MHLEQLYIRSTTKKTTFDWWAKSRLFNRTWAFGSFRYMSTKTEPERSVYFASYLWVWEVIWGIDSDSIIPSPCRIFLNDASGRALVKTSTSWSMVLTKWISTFPSSTWSLMKWYLSAMCLVFECCTGLWQILIALSESQYRGYFSYWVHSPGVDFGSKSLEMYRRQLRCILLQQ